VPDPSAAASSAQCRTVLILCVLGPGAKRSIYIQHLKAGAMAQSFCLRFTFAETVDAMFLFGIPFRGIKRVDMTTVTSRL